MDIALIIIIAALFVLAAFVSLKGRRARRAAREHQQGEARVIAEKSKAQHEESERRQAGVKAAYAEGASKSISDPDEERTP
jgi:Na+-transporting methylmalonyl-CoA/oxaloacetate decarboxylase gamma subunit